MRVEVNILFGNNQLIFIYREGERVHVTKVCRFIRHDVYELRIPVLLYRYTFYYHQPPAGSMLLLLLRLIGKTKHLILFHTISLILSEKSSQEATECDFGQTEDTHTK